MLLLPSPASSWGRKVLTSQPVLQAATSSSLMHVSKGNPTCENCVSQPGLPLVFSTPCKPLSVRASVTPGCPDLQSHSHLGSQLPFTVSLRAAGMKTPFLCQTAAGNLRRHWPTPATSERGAEYLEVIYENICNSKKTINGG